MIHTCTMWTVFECNQHEFMFPPRDSQALVEYGTAGPLYASYPFAQLGMRWCNGDAVWRTGVLPYKSTRWEPLRTSPIGGLGAGLGAGKVQ